LKIGFVQAYAKAMGPDARKLDPGSQPTFGRDAILAQMSRYPTGDAFTWTPVEAVVAQSGELGYTWGRWTDVYRDKHGKIARAYGKYLDIWRRGADGTWRWVVDMGNSNPAPPG
jgi:ketosteroid isomerase-like protein